MPHLSNRLSRAIQRILPRQLHPFGAALYWIGLKYRCPICGWPTRAFRPLAVNPEFAERCSRCGSMARHRLLWLFPGKDGPPHSAAQSAALLAGSVFMERFRRMPNLDYTTADIAGGYTSWMETLDVTNIAKPDNTFDVVLCLHVLQAVEDDRLAMREMLRVLKPGGWAILNSRMDSKAEETRPHPALPSPEERARAVHKDFCFRIYGQDFGDRLRDEGFKVDVVPFRESLSQRQIERYGIQTPSDIFLCRKPNC